MLGERVGAQDLADQLRQLGPLDDAAAPDPFVDFLGGFEGHPEVDAAGHEGMHHDSAHERTPSGGVIHLHAALVCGPLDLFSRLRH